MAGSDELQRWPCRSSHRISVSFDGLEPLTITLPYPILSDTLKATLRRTDGVVDLVAAKALEDLWPEDVIRNQFRWNAEMLESCTDKNLIFRHLNSQFEFSSLGQTSTFIDKNHPERLFRIRSLIATIFHLAVRKNNPFTELRSSGPLGTKELRLRAHLPVRISPRGSPLLLLSVLDQRRVEAKQGDAKFKQILCGGNLSRKFDPFFTSAEDAQLLRYILLINSTKIQLVEWQKKNLPQGGDSPWHATFIQPLYLDNVAPTPSIKPAGSCLKCGQLNDGMKHCSRCKSAPYCSVDCQRAHWPEHKLSCSKS